MFTAIKQQIGITLIEFLVTISIAAILMTIAIPNFKDFLKRNRIDSVTSDLVTALNYARSESIRRGVNVSICKSSDGISCGGNEINWEQGWIVFVNLDNDSPAFVDANEEIVWVRQQLAQNITLRASNNYENFLTYKPTGRVNKTGSFVICYNNELIGAKHINIIGTGRVQISKDANNDGIPEKDSNGVYVNITSCNEP